MHQKYHISAILLAAGSSSRMRGENKLLLQVAGKAILTHSYTNVKAANPDAVFVVTGDDFSEIERLLRDEETTQIKRCKTAALGMSESLKAGVLAAGKNSDGVLILLADQPLISTQTIRRFIRQFNARHRLIAGGYQGFIGCPAIFHRDYFQELNELEGDKGARAVLHRHLDAVTTIPIPAEEGVDIDTPEDLARILALLEDDSV